MSRLLPPLCLSLLWVASARAQPATAAPAATPAPTATPAPQQVLLMPLEADADGKDEAPGLTALLVSRLSESPFLTVSTPSDADSVRRMGLCGQGPCPEAKPEDLKARYIITGRLDVFGTRFVLTTTLLDAESGKALRRPRIEVAARDALPRAALDVADQLRAGLLPPPEARISEERVDLPTRMPNTGSFLVGLRFNNSLISNFSSFNPGGDVEIGFQFHPEWVVFGQVGFSYVSTTTAGAQGGVNVLPSVLGLRHYHNIESPLRPYWGLGVGVQLSFGEFGIFRSTGALPTVIGFGGLEYLFFGHLGVQLEASTNIAQAVLGLSDGGLGGGLNLDINLGIAWHFF